MKRTLLALCLVCAALSTAAARKPEDVFGGHILVSDQPFPTNARSEEAFISAVKKQAKERLQEDKESHEWTVFFAAFFKQPVNDLEVTLRVVDVTKGERLVESFEQYLPTRGQRAYLSSLTMKRGDGSSGYDPNSKVRIVMESHGRVIAEATLFLAGEARKFNGKVDFSEEEKK